MLAKITVKDISDKIQEIQVYSILEIKEGKGGAFSFTFTGDDSPVQGTEGKVCRKISYSIKGGEKKTINTFDSIDEIKKKILAAKASENFNQWLDDLIK